MLRSRYLPPPVALGAIFQPFPALCPFEPRLPRGGMKSVPYGARSNTRLLPACSSQPPPAGIRPVRIYRYMFFLSKIGPYILPRLISPQERGK